jgi:hypothetical protein
MRRIDRAVGRLALLFLPLSFASAGCTAELKPPVLQPIGGERPVKSAGSSVLFVVGGDNRPTQKGAPLPPVFTTLFQEIGWIHPDLVIWSGDAVYGYCDSRPQLDAEYRRFRAIAELPRVPLYNAPGNHEIHADVSRCSEQEKAAACAGEPCAVEAYHRNFGDLYGSFDVGDVHFIALDAERIGKPYPEVDPEQMRWLRADLEEHQHDRAIFVFSHSEFYSSPVIDFAQGQGHPAIANRAELHELFRRYPVKAVFSGHEHVYWHEPAESHDFIHYIVAGGAGAPLYAPPERGGFAHYLLVQVGAGPDSKVSYNVIEPGHLGMAEGASVPEGDTLWFVNGNDTVDPKLPIRQLEATLQAGQYGSCAELRAGLQPGYSFASCTDAADGSKLVFAPFDVQAGRSVRLWVGHKKK